MPPRKKKTKRTQSCRPTTYDSTIFGGSPMAASSPVTLAHIPQELSYEHFLSLRDSRLQEIDRDFDNLKETFLSAIEVYKSITAETKDDIYCDVETKTHDHPHLASYVEATLAKIISERSGSSGKATTRGNEKNDENIHQNAQNALLPPSANATVIKKKRQSRSLESNRSKTDCRLKRAQSGDLQERPIRNNFQTPLSKLQGSGYYVATVTPGPNINAPTAIYRHPNPDEVVISLSGSPLLVSSSVQRSACGPQISIPLEDGRVLAVLAKEGLTAASLPRVDSDTLKQLKLLQNFLKENV